MATTAGNPAAIPERREIPNFRPYLMRAAYAAAAALILSVAVYGFGYYALPLSQRASSPLHPILKPSGLVGLRLGIFGFALYCVLFLYPIRKKVQWLNRIGKTKNWLDFHVLCGLAAPFVITLHSSFKLSGIAGVAYWIMVAVAASGVVGRYLYCQIPRRLNTAEISHRELETMSAELATQMETFSLFTPSEMASLLSMPSREQVREMSIVTAFFTALLLDLKRPFQVRKLRVRFLSQAERYRTLGGLLASNHEDLERMISIVRRQAWLRAKMLFLEHVQKIFHLWHVVHRPFSYSFAVLVTIHLAVVVLMGYY